MELAGPVTNGNEKTFVLVTSASTTRELVALYDGKRIEFISQTFKVSLDVTHGATFDLN